MTSPFPPPLQVSAAQAAGGVTAFSRPRQHVPKADALELAELSAAMEALEDDSEGDLEDDFLLTATEVCVMLCRLRCGYF